MEISKRSVATASLDIAYEQTGVDSAEAILLLHGFPYDVRQYDAVRSELAASDRRIIVPYLRGYGPTRYKTQQVFRSGQQAALGKDVVDLLDALSIQQAILVGYDWGGRAACVAAALWPERVRGLVSASGYAIQNIAKASSTPLPAEKEYALWYQSYFNTERGRLGLDKNRDEFCKFLWKLWSPTWRFTDEQYNRTAESFRNPDFVNTVIQSYRHRYANAPGDPALEDLEARLAQQPAIAAPTVVLHGADDQVEPPSTTDSQEQHFAGAYDRKILAGVGHCVPAESPHAVSRAVESLLKLI